MTLNIPSKPLCIMIDWDGTLVDAEPIIHKAYIETFKSLKSPLADTWTQEDTHNQNGLSPHLIFNKTSIWGTNNCGMDGKAHDLFYAHFREISGKETDAPYFKENAIEFLHTLKSKYHTVRFVLVAAKSQEILEQEVAHKKELNGFFHLIIGSNPQKGIHKQSEYTSEIATMGLKISCDKTKRSSDVLYIGDNPLVDTAFANLFGAFPIIVNDKEETAHFKSLQEMSNALKNEFLKNNRSYLNQNRISSHIVSYYDYQKLK